MARHNGLPLGGEGVYIRTVEFRWEPHKPGRVNACLDFTDIPQLDLSSDNRGTQPADEDEMRRQMQAALDALNTKKYGVPLERRYE